MSRLSLRGRMALLFVIVVTAVLSLAAVSFDYFCRLHFQQQDAAVLEGKVSALESLLSRGSSLEPEMVSDIHQLVDTSFGFAAAILAGDRVIYSHHNLSEELAASLGPRQGERWLIQVGSNRYSGMTERIEGWADGEGGTIHLAMDVTHRTHFFEMIRRWFFYTLIISAALSGALGFVFIRRGLEPISSLSRTSSTITANCLDTRISTESVPSELHELVDNFNAMLERLDQSFLRLSSFSADIAHELRTPLNSMLTQTEVALLKERDSADYKDVLFSTLEELRRMSRMVDDMLFLAKADNGMITPDFEDHDLSAIAAGVLEYYEYAADEKEIKLALHSTGTSKVKGDNLMLRRAISNVMSNAVRYGEPGSTVDIKVSNAREWARLEVSNQGPTIAPDHVDKLFDRFYRIDTARREGNTLNAGLGMAITRSIVEAHEGSIDCHSANGVTTFQMRLPIAVG
ncbi:two-component system, OmpR family, heavy metal sensor histidine kinase CusS [Halopseudomonas xinjiangensis]|uniref:Sensor protein n=1 Tax=Halopseudomonas xinjiangensis TaxID=487184 RepID=A0A1H1SXG1_9GAMM|nr:heavy metal sensor histidine kinase [Halopseudomonas xinjiangensis]SDS52727.1 two-component system, OmpR family, heavy metal sensor histidine kinase CusS [Halopseudomonas xinjiangensis]